MLLATALETEELSTLELWKQQRDHKRRRQTYRAKNVHITKRSQTEVSMEWLLFGKTLNYFRCASDIRIAQCGLLDETKNNAIFLTMKIVLFLNESLYFMLKWHEQTQKLLMIFENSKRFVKPSAWLKLPNWCGVNIYASLLYKEIAHLHFCFSHIITIKNRCLDTVSHCWKAVMYNDYMMLFVRSGHTTFRYVVS